MKQLILASLVATTLASGTVFAQARARATAATFKADMVKEMTRIQTHVFGQGRKNTAGLANQARDASVEKLLNELGNDVAHVKSGLRAVLLGDAVEGSIIAKRQKAISELAAIKKIATELKTGQSEADKAEGTSLEKFANAHLDLIAKAGQYSNKPAADRMSEADVNDTNASLIKLIEMSKAIADMKVTERDSYTTMVEEANNQVGLQGKTIFEALRDGAKLSKKAKTDEEGMAVIRKIKGCQNS